MVTNICERPLGNRSGNHLEANKFAVEVIKTLTPRLADSQSNLKPLAASALAEVASSVTSDSAIKVQSIHRTTSAGSFAVFCKASESTV